MTKEMIVLENLRLDIIQRRKELTALTNFSDDEDAKTRWYIQSMELDNVSRLIDDHLIRLRKEAHNERT